MFILKHKNIDVVVIDNEFNVLSVLEDRLPTLDEASSISLKQLSKNLKEWFIYRQLPRYRDGLPSNFEIKISNFLSQGHCLSLSDNYWICPATHKDILWEDINYYKRGFSSVYGKKLALEQPILFNDFNSPDISTNGFLRKFWELENGVPYLYKTSYYGFEPYNEKFCSRLLENHNKILGTNISYIPYDVVGIHRQPFSKCPSFTNQDLDYIPAYFIENKGKKPNEMSNYEFFLEKAYNITGLDVQKELDTMLSLDFLVENIDRHFYNFGFLRDSNTLEFKSFVPIFDTGTCLLLNVFSKGKPFKTDTARQMKQLKYKFVFDDKIILDTFDDVFHAIMEKSSVTRRINKLLFNNNQLRKYKEKDLVQSSDYSSSPSI